MQDDLRATQAEINRMQRLVDELCAHMDEEGRVQAFVYSPDLAEAMRDEQLSDPNDALALFEDYVDELLQERNALERKDRGEADQPEGRG
jgi:hypothetical protein